MTFRLSKPGGKFSLRGVGGSFKLIIPEIVTSSFIETFPYASQTITLPIINACVPYSGPTVTNGVAWFRIVLPETMNINVNTLGSVLEGDSEIGVYDITGSLLGTNDDTDSSAEAGTDYLSSLTLFNLPAGPYYVAVGAYNTYFENSGWSASSGDSIPENCDFKLTAEQIELPWITNAQVITLPTSDICVPDSGASVNNNKVAWFKLILPSETAVNFNTEGSVAGADTEIGVYDSSGAWMGDNDNSGIGNTSWLSFGDGWGNNAPGTNLYALPAGEYYIAVAQNNASFGDNGFNVSSTRNLSGSCMFKLSASVIAPTPASPLPPAPSVPPTSGMITDGLVMFFDVENVASYVGSGSSWTDLSLDGNEYPGVVVGNPTFVDVSPKHFIFDGTDYAYSQLVNADPMTSFTLNVWAKPTNFGPIFQTLLDFPNDRWFFGFDENEIITYNPNFYTGFYLANNNWYNLSLAHTAGGPAKVYVNGALVYTSPTNPPSMLGATGAYVIGAGGGTLGAGGPNEGFKGHYAVAQIYNRELTAEEIAQNYYYFLPRYD